MSDLKKYIEKRKSKSPEFAREYESGYENFKIGYLIHEARKDAGLTQQELADLIHSTKSAVSRMENHAEDMKLSTLEKVIKALGKKMKITIE